MEAQATSEDYLQDQICNTGYQMVGGFAISAIECLYVEADCSPMPILLYL